MTGRRGRRLGVLFEGARTTSRDRYLVRELLKDESVVDHIVVIAAPREASSADRWISAMAARLVEAAGRSRSDPAPIGNLAGPRVDVISCGIKELPGVVRDSNLDALIDLRRSNDAAALSRLVPFGVAQIWCDGRPGNLSFESTFRRRSWHLALSVSVAGSSPEIVMDLRQAPTVPVLVRDRQMLAGRATAFLLRWLRGVAAKKRGGVITRAPESSPILALASAIRSVAEQAYSRVRRIIESHERWFVAVRNEPSGALSLSSASPCEFQVFEPFREGFVADPCVFRRGDVDYVFYEEYQFSDRHGVISYSTIEATGQLTPPRRVLVEPYHLSYPFVFEHDGNVYMIPESAANKTVDLYRAAEFPDRWERMATLLTGVNAVDSTPYHDGTRWWLFTNIGEHGSSTWDELFLFYSDALAGRWQPHSANPVKSDASSSRPAGALWTENGRLIRPAQDCSVRYGGGISLCQIESLTTSEFRERVIARIPAETFQECDGFHTISRSSRIEVIDAKWKPATARKRVPARIISVAPELSIRSAASLPK